MVGLLFAASAVVQVAEGAGEGEEAEAGVGYLSDEVVGVWEGLILGLGVGPFLAELVCLRDGRGGLRDGGGRACV